jgi:hypothetical protein
MNGPDTLAEIVTAPWRDEETLERAAQAVRFYRAIADAIENDPDLAPEMLFHGGNVSVNAKFYSSTHERDFINAASRLLGAKPQIAEGWLEVRGEVEGVPTAFYVSPYGLPKRKVTREVEEYEYVLDDEIEGAR